MKAWTWTSGGFPKALHESDLPEETAALKPTEIRVRTRAAAINPVDVQLMGYPLMAYAPKAVLPAHKGVGEDFSGVVEEAGTKAGFAKGDEVFGIIWMIPKGTLSEVVTIDTNSPGKVVVLKKPVGWSFEAAAAIPLVWITAMTCIARVEAWMDHLEDSDAKLVVLGGSSSTGMYVTYIAKQRGWHVTATCSGAKADFVRSMGADEVIDYTTASVPGEVKKVSPEAIIDCVGGRECIGLAKRYVTVVGDKKDRLSMGGQLTYLSNPQMLARAVRGWTGLASSYTCINLEYKEEYLKEALSLPSEKIHIDSTFEFGQVKEAFDRLNTGKTKGKVVVRVAA